MHRIKALQDEIAHVMSEPVGSLLRPKTLDTQVLPESLDQNPPVKTNSPTVTITDTADNDLIWKEVAQIAHAHSIVSFSDLMGNITQVNDNFLQISKYSKSELIGQPHSLLRSNFHPKSFFDRMWKTIRSGESWKGTIKNKAKDGSYYWVKTLITPIKDASGTIVSYASIRTDVTDFLEMKSQKKQLERKANSIDILNSVYAIDRQDKSLRDIILSALNVMFNANCLKVLQSGGVYLANEDNKSLKLIANYNMKADEADEVRQIGFDDCPCGETAKNKKPIFAMSNSEKSDKCFSSASQYGSYNVPIMLGDELIGVLVVYLVDGAVRDLYEEEFLADFSHALGVIVGFKLREDDLLSTRRSAELAADKANKAMLEAQAAELAKTNFLATMSHELRTPLNGITGMLYSIQQSPLNPEQLEDMQIAISSADLLVGLLSDILDFSKLEYGAVNLETLPVDTRQLAKEVVVPFRGAAADKNLKLVHDIDESLPEIVLADPTRLKQISTNLISNAIKFTKNGIVHVSVKLCDPPKNDKFGTKWVITRITDTGIGIPLESQTMVFDRFSQADNSTTRQFGGTGLGLAICKQLVERMGGEIGVISEPGKGSCFWFKLPLIPVN
ncbi:MAG: PAS domain-containing protein [Robiginitomaculum sp.]|nr:PAS domain-containing protein [Robiginitomaculum sp.]